MNCCDDFGQCKQGAGCPVREATVPGQLAPLPALSMIDTSLVILAYLLGVGTGAGLVLLYLTQVVA